MISREKCMFSLKRITPLKAKLVKYHLDIFLCMQSNYIHSEIMSREQLTYYKSSFSLSKILNYTNHFPNLTLIVSTPIYKTWQTEFTKLRFFLDINNISDFKPEFITLLSYSLSSEYKVWSFSLLSGVNSPDSWIQDIWGILKGLERGIHTSISI